jgi:hypothetical protein
MLGRESAELTLDLYGHLYENRLGEVAERMDAARTAALAELAPNRRRTEVVPLGSARPR